MSTAVASATTTPAWMVTAACAVITLQLIRVSVDLIQVASKSSPAVTSSNGKGSQVKKQTAKEHRDNGTQPLIVDSATDTSPDTITSKARNSQTIPTNSSTYGSIETGTDGSIVAFEAQPLLASESMDAPSATRDVHRKRRIHVVMLTAWTLVFGCFWIVHLGSFSHVYSNPSLIAAEIVTSLEVLLYCRDWDRERYGLVARWLQITSTIGLWIIYTTQAILAADQATTLVLADHLCLVAVTVLVGLSILDRWWWWSLSPARRESLQNRAKHQQIENAKAQLSRAAILTLLKPYFWPDATGPSDQTAFWNRIRAIATWICVFGSKACGLVSPLFLGWASTALAHQQYAQAIQYSVGYAALTFVGSTLKEGQSLVYLKVAQAAFVQLSETAFGHLHSLSLDWHLSKKMGEVLRSMDRGIAACDTLMKYLFLWLIPALIECIVVCIIFATYFQVRIGMRLWLFTRSSRSRPRLLFLTVLHSLYQYLPLAITVFYFVFAYIVWTILVTLWRKKFRKALVQSDNEYHDRFTDSMINFETVKYFTAEAYEQRRFKEAVSRYQAGSVHVQSSLSFLNISQQLLLKACLAAALSLAALGIKKRVDCCVAVVGCDSGVSQCCQDVSTAVCPGMQVGDFVAVLTYTLNLFAPLNFLGSIYNAVVMAVIDLTNLSELLAENPDVTDAPDAMTIPDRNVIDPDVAVEFDNVYFHYPTQPSTKGLQGMSFKMKRGTTTAIVGPTGAGKVTVLPWISLSTRCGREKRPNTSPFAFFQTTVSRLLFRFYDVLGGAVKVNGVDVRSVTQKSLRGAMGVVPQAASMFNDTIRTNLRYGRRDATQEDLEQAARDAQLLGFVESLDDGWDTMVGDRGLKLSGGEKQRAAIARCLLKDPPFVLLDEATSALDTLTESSVQEALDRLGAERTVLVIAHRLGTIRNADNIIVLKEGKVYEQGTHDQLLLQNGVYSDMWNMQLHSTSGATSQLSLPHLADESTIV
jgi:ABC-type transport system involved in Fe-S cluster assembly fused permease/ATPase subunit